MTKMDRLDMLAYKILRLCKFYVSMSLEGKCADLGPNPDGVNELLDHLCFVRLGRRPSSEYRHDVSDLDTPFLRYLESSFYWHQVLRKLNLIDAKCDDVINSDDIRKKVWNMIEHCQYGIEEIFKGNIRGTPKERSYLEIVYNPRKGIEEEEVEEDSSD